MAGGLIPAAMDAGIREPIPIIHLAQWMSDQLRENGVEKIFLFFITQSKPEIMESYWYKKKNSTIIWMNGKLSLTLATRLKTDGILRRRGECIHICESGKKGSTRIHQITLMSCVYFIVSRG